MYRPRDYYHRRARAEGYRARSAFKLLEIQRRFRLLRRGDLVLDLGAWPGGWTQVAVEIVGPRGRVVAVDKVPLRPFSQPNVELLELDVGQAGAEALIGRALGRRADVLLSDLAPKLSGIRASDQMHSVQLASRALAIAGSLLAPGGRALLKTFAAALPEVRSAARARFGTIHLTRPRATRSRSGEVYLVGIGFRAPKGKAGAGTA